LDESLQRGTIEVMLIDATGIPVDADATITVQLLQNGKAGPEMRIARKTVLNYGTYNLTVRASPAYPVDKVITVRERYQPILIPLFTAPIELPAASNTVEGEIPAESKRRRCRWVRLISPVSERDYADAIASPDGRFVVENIKPGLYLVVTFGPSGMCEMRKAVVADKRSQIIVLQ
jgi:hypothetical protein